MTQFFGFFSDHLLGAHKLCLFTSSEIMPQTPLTSSCRRGLCFPVITSSSSGSSGVVHM